MKKILLSFSFATLLFSAKAQITITSSSFPNVGDTQILHHNTTTPLGGSIVPGNSGANQSWNFSAMLNESSDTTLIVATSSTAFAANFPSASFAALQTGGTIGYLKKTSTDVELIGAAAAFSTGGVNIPTTSAAYTSPNVLAKAGIAYMSSYNFPTALKQTIAAPSGISIPYNGQNVTVDSIRLTQSSTVYNKVDAYGSVTTPKGTFACIRQKDSTISDTKIEVKINDTITVGTLHIPITLWYTVSNTQGKIAVSYSYKDNNNIVDIATLNMMDSTSSTVNSASYREKNGAQSSGIANVMKPSVFSVYPNPTSDNFKVIIGGLPDNEYTLCINNILGNKISETKSKVWMNTASAVDFSNLNLSNGNYIITVADNNGKILDAKKIEVIR